MAGDTILLIEDSDAVALGLQYALDKEGYRVIRAATAADARQMAYGNDFDLILLDIRLPDGSGFDLCREFRASGLRHPILILTARDETIDKIIGLELGADDYVTKPFELHELLARIRALLRRTYGPLSEPAQSRISLGDLSLNLTTQQVTRGREVIHLTSTEFKLLAFLAYHRGQVFDRQTLLEKVWGYEEIAGDERTIDVHIRNLRHKIEPDPSQPKYIVTIRGIGYMLNH